jgi:diadenosine tetraphosphate (Ap4A) HIT family hydrolase
VSPGECYFCGQIAGDAGRDLIAQLLPDVPYVRRVMLESPSFAALPSLGPLTDGHTLLCPKAHVRSLAAVPGELEAEYQDVARRLEDALTAMYGGSVLRFEHGMARDGDRVPCTVDHAHLHFVPLGGVPVKALVPELPWQPYDGSLRGLRRLAGPFEYLSVRASAHVHLVATGAAGTFESQFMRRVVAARAAAAWNWREQPRPAAAHSTWEQFAARATRA